METNTVHAVVIGHSYARRLGQWMRDHPSRANLGVRSDRDRVMVHCYGLGGASFRSGRKNFVDYVDSVMSQLSFRVSVVVVHVGENDIQFTDPGSLFQEIRDVLHLLSVCYGVPLTVVSQLLVFPAFDHRRASVIAVNSQLEWALRANSKFLFWKHRGVFGILDEITTSTMVCI